MDVDVIEWNRVVDGRNVVKVNVWKAAAAVAAAVAVAVALVV